LIGLNRQPKNKMHVITLVDRVALEIQGRILSGQWAVGSHLPTGKALAQEFGVSNAVVREAIARMQSQGLVETRQGSRTLVIGKTISDGFSLPVYDKHEAENFADAYELRRDLEVAAASHAALRRTSFDLIVLEDCLHNMHHSSKEASGADADSAFHLAIAAATNNKHYVNLVQYLNSQLNLRNYIAIAWENSARHLNMPEAAYQEHVDIYRAIKQQDQEKAALAMTTHVNNAAQRLALPYRPVTG
jgi:GntR family transcriptional repressor for pyruvate dehydrogenase complex